MAELVCLGPLEGLVTALCKPFCARGAIMVDVAFAIVIVGLAVVALMSSVQGATRGTAALNDRYRAIAIARSAHEWATAMPPATIETHFPAGASYPKLFTPGLIDAHGDALTGYPAGWSQQLSLTKLNALTLAPDAAGELVELTVTARKNGADGQPEPMFRLTRVYSP